jgi:hypothetical protein
MPVPENLPEARTAVQCQQPGRGNQRPVERRRQQAVLVTHMVQLLRSRNPFRSPVVVGVGVVRLQRDGPVVRREGLGELPQVPQGVAQVVVRIGIVGPELDRVAVLILTLISSPQVWTPGRLS